MSLCELNKNGVKIPAVGLDNIYGDNEILLSKVLKDRRNEVFLCSKFGIVIEPNGEFKGISETLRRAYKVHPIAAVQFEYSPWTLDIETNGIMEACRELGVTIVAYSPLGLGFLTGNYKSIDDFESDDYEFRRLIPRFQGENFNKNLEIVHKFNEFAEKEGVTSGQLCLAWVLAQGDNMVVIASTGKIKHLEENVEAVKVNLSSAEELSEIRKIINSIEIIGNRYNDDYMKGMMEYFWPIRRLKIIKWVT
ncbi:putative Aldo/keto reductase [Rhizophagus irregularis DAOM 181602=DAOM 197198]|uniref:Aldo/keto reductase n=1 Tax=Rhizophagus irregularis (strain DAOM 181602 / DAOM 197198 / MUCL 43194) TaxID=747089 RepID=A0A2P4Q2P1_RHIID|nr:putative Aldo/keto reductase [Rhizophagus irregularis DAOM 181602=DAOM 197198]PKY28697.1 Aldo/keto reductase [Rhizophagus irregularis]POG71862.1 putative Aldo/keto reductase [Rhizophagus irregularis DAOM 181602=DAOM 197198]|eukprot:XP_025178728.1 putative Aldo/keto reductase [Rhizophagus irregularis DAOM 181602=DAOM 197198]